LKICTTAEPFRFPTPIEAIAALHRRVVDSVPAALVAAGKRFNILAGILALQVFKGGGHSGRNLIEFHATCSGGVLFRSRGGNTSSSAKLFPDFA
jgi:hypothetical protein